MPFDVAKWNGTWKHSGRSDNYPQIMQKLGLSAEAIQKFQESEMTMGTSLSGDVLTVKVDFIGKTVTNTNTLGVEGVEEGITGKKTQSIWTMDGDCLVALYPNFDGNGLVVSQKRSFVDDNKMLIEMKAGDLEGWVEHVRC
ncbi:Hypp7034 [Branchiostoma lanceolatum]|uniref:Hypp7034 protein n=2 Tax=Branchiostoma lanceolatum TaxID=7740 RepID=A0A8K0E6N3_BRALA|nr:Hypp7034 [Branchiostoma lanceolatum]